MSKQFLSKDITTSQDLSSGELDYTTSISHARKLNEIHFIASQAITETITISIDSKNGANYDIDERKKNFVSERYWVYRPEGEKNLQKDDEIKLHCTNANGVGTIRAVIKTSEL